MVAGLTAAAVAQVLPPPATSPPPPPPFVVDTHSLARGGRSVWLHLICSGCGELAALYQKDYGAPEHSGPLHRGYLDRCAGPAALAARYAAAAASGTAGAGGELRCSACNKLLGRPLLYGGTAAQPEARPCWQFERASLIKRTLDGAEYEPADIEAAAVVATIDAGMLREYCERGFCTVPGVLDAALCARVSRAIDTVYRTPEIRWGLPELNGRTDGNMVYIPLDPGPGLSPQASEARLALLALYQHEALEQVARVFLQEAEGEDEGEGLDLHSATIMMKRPECETAAAAGSCTAPLWDTEDEHQDFQHLVQELDSNDTVLTLQILLEDYPLGQGNTYVRPRSHRQVAEWLARTGHTPLRRRCGWGEHHELPPIGYDEAVPLTGKQGDVMPVNFALVHTASRNVTDRARKVVFLNFAPRRIDYLTTGGPGYKPEREQWRSVLRRCFPPSRRHLVQPAFGLSPGTVRVGAVQMVSDGDNVDGNYRKAEAFCRRAKQRGVQILCFPECASTGFDWLAEGRGPAACPRAEAVGDGSKVVERFERLAAELDIYIIWGCVERDGEPEDEQDEEAGGSAADRRLYNTAVLVGPMEGYIGKFRKVTAESVFVDGEEAPVFRTRYGRIGIFICSDMRLPELARLLVLKGAQLLFQPTNYFHTDADPADVAERYLGKQTAQRARSIENDVAVVVANAGRTEYVNNSR